MSVTDQPRYAPNTVGEEEFVQAVSDMAREVWDFTTAGDSDPDISRT